MRWAACVACATAMAAQAADLQVAPISLQFAPADKAQALWLTNSGDRPLHAQVRVYRWSQDEDEDRLEPTQGLVPSPPLVEIAPGQSQLVRVVRKEAPSGDGEASYRLIVDEIPEHAPAQGDNPAGTAGAGRNGLRLVLRYSVPVFVGGESSRKAPDIALVSGAWVAGKVPSLAITNAGARRLRVSQVVHEDPGGRRTVLVPGLLGYVLAGHRRRWELPGAGKDLGPGVIKARLHEALQEFPVATVSGSP